MTTPYPTIPGQPDGIKDDSRDLPSPIRAAKRLREYISANGDGIYDVIDGNPLYARDLESLRRAGEQVGSLVMEQEKVHKRLDDARQVVRRLVHMEREQLGSGPDGHLSERDLAPLLHALHIDPEETD